MLATGPVPAPAVLERLAEREGLTATRFKQYLEASHCAEQRGREPDEEAAKTPTATSTGLDAYAQLGQPSGHRGVTHEPA